MSTVAARTYTPAELLSLPDAQSCELIDGELVEKNVSAISSQVETRLIVRLGLHCSQSDLGEVWPGSMGYQCFPWAPKEVRKPDVSFIRKDRITPELWKEGFIQITPDLAVEVISPNDLVYETDLKLEEYLRAKIPLVWVINPDDHVIMAYRKDGSMSRLRDGDELSGEDVVPGFRCRVCDLFPQISS